MLHSLRYLLLAGLLLSVAQPAPDKKSALDKPTLEAYVRHLFVWGSQIKVDISDPKPAPLPGMLEVNVHASAGNASQDLLFYICKDGQKIAQGAVFDVKPAFRLKNGGTAQFGDSVVVTENGARRLGKREMKVVKLS